MRLYTLPDFGGRWTQGSEPSLSGHVTGSVRTLVSQENMSPSNQPNNQRPVTTTTSPPLATDATATGTHNATSTEATSILPNMNDLDLIQGSSSEVMNFDTSPAKTPSYLNAARLASGYTSYSSYTPATQARHIRVLRKTDESSESDSSLNTSVTLKQGEGQGEGQPVTNGHLVVGNDLKSSKQGHGLDSVDSARISSSSSNVKVISRTHDSSPQPANGDLGAGAMSRSSQGQESSGSHEEELKLELPDVTSPDTPVKDGHYFLDVMRREEKRIQELCSLAESYLQDNHGEEVNGKLRATIGKANLLTSKKFNQFRGLCQKCNERDDLDPFPIMPKDLVGFWDMVSIQVDDVTAMFHEIERMRLSGWTQVQTPTTTAKSSVAKTTRKSPRSKTTSSQSQQRSQEAARARDRAREEARKRLLAAKKAGRMRKRSNSDKEEIEIFVPE